MKNIVLYRLLEKRFSDSYILYDAAQQRPEASAVAEKCYPAIKVDKRLRHSPRIFLILESEIGEYEEYEQHPMISAIVSHAGGKDVLHRKFLELS